MKKQTPPLVPLKYLGRIVSGGTPATDDSNWGGQVPFVTPPDLNGLHGAAIAKWERTLTEQGASSGTSIETNAVLLSCRAPIGHIGIAKEPVAFNQGCKAVVPENADDLRYIAYCLVASRDALEAAGRGTTFTELSAQGLLSHRVPWAAEAERVLIADYLDRETGAIDAMIGKLDELAGRLRQRASREAVLFGLNEGESSSGTAHSPIEGIPPHWQQSRFGIEFTESAERNSGTPSGPLLSISEYRGVEENTRIDGQQASLDVSKYRVVRPGQLAANMMWLNHGGLGVSELTGYISPDYKAFWISPRFEPRYIHYLLRSPRYVDYFAAIATGVRPNAQRVTNTSLGMMPLPVPPLDEQRHIADQLDEASVKLEAMAAKVAELKALLLERRAALITDVVTGQKEVA